MKQFKSTEDPVTQYVGKMIEVITQKMSDGSKEVAFEWGQRAPGVRLIAINSDGKILLTKEFRYELDTYDYRLPGGKVADSLEEWHRLLDKNGVESAASKKVIEEAKEEAGLHVKTASLIEIVPDGATFKWDLYYFETRDFTLTSQSLGQGEDISTGWYSPSEVKQFMKQKLIREGRSVYMLMPYVL